LCIFFCSTNLVILYNGSIKLSFPFHQFNIHWGREYKLPCQSRLTGRHRQSASRLRTFPDHIAPGFLSDNFSLPTYVLCIEAWWGVPLPLLLQT
jgi:hypothetical protein